MRRKLVWGNWKMNGSAAANAALPGSLAMHAKSIAGRVDVGVCVPAVYLEQDRRELAGATAAWGVQDVSAHECGAYTGEISEHMVSEFGATYAIVGHSERRINHGETGATIGEKARQALSAGLVPVVCVGESEAQRDAGIAEEYVCVQLTAVLNVLAPGQAEQIVVAYEPVWAIGTGRSATAAQAQSMHAAIRACLLARGGRQANVRLLYGGSVNPGSAYELFRCEDVDGGLVGGASLKSADFIQIIGAATGATGAMEQAHPTCEAS